MQTHIRELDERIEKESYSIGNNELRLELRKLAEDARETRQEMI